MNEHLNFLVTNRIPRALMTKTIGKLSTIENQLFTRLGIGLWQWFDPIDLEEAETKQFSSLQDCFTRRLKSGARPVDLSPGHMISPCDAIVGECGAVREGQLYQIKGAPYRLDDLIPDKQQHEKYWNGRYVTLRLKSSMYHRFHAPCDCHMKRVTYISGDTWNVNPPALKRIESLFCKNERAVVELEIGPERLDVTLVAVAAILVASIKLHALPQTLDLSYSGPKRVVTDAHYRKGAELGYFKQGSTIIMFVDEDFELADGIQPGKLVRMGQVILKDRLSTN